MTSLKQSGDGDDVSEELSFNYRTITESYLPQKPDGSPGAPIVGGWDLVRNMQFGPAAC